MCKSLEKISFGPKNMDRPVHVIHPKVYEFSSMAGYNVLRTILPSGMQIAIDPTALQMGWKEVMTPWLPYVNHRVQILFESVPPLGG